MKLPSSCPLLFFLSFYFTWAVHMGFTLILFIFKLSLPSFYFFLFFFFWFSGLWHGALFSFFFFFACHFLGIIFCQWYMSKFIWTHFSTPNQQKGGKSKYFISSYFSTPPTKWILWVSPLTSIRSLSSQTQIHCCCFFFFFPNIYHHFFLPNTYRRYFFLFYRFFLFIYPCFFFFHCCCCFFFFHRCCFLFFLFFLSPLLLLPLYGFLCYQLDLILGLGWWVWAAIGFDDLGFVVDGQIWFCDNIKFCNGLWVVVMVGAGWWWVAVEVVFMWERQ